MRSINSPPINFGCHSFLNAKPLIYPLIKGYMAHEFNLILDSPSKISELLRESDLDIGMIPSIEFFRSENYLLVPDFGISSMGKVDSVLLFSQKTLPELSKIAVDTNSRTSIVMLKIIFRERHYRDPVLIPMQADLHNMLQEAEAGLIIGDRALMTNHNTPYVYDLGEEWYLLTGKPFVHALMAVWPGKDLDSELGILKKAQNLGLSRLPEIAQEGAVNLGLDYEVCLDYLQNKIRYELGPAELEGLTCFATLAKEYNLIPKRDITLRYFQ
jgi:chorismate dehydratase